MHMCSMDATLLLTSWTVAIHQTFILSHSIFCLNEWHVHLPQQSFYHINSTYKFWFYLLTYLQKGRKRENWCGNVRIYSRFALEMDIARTITVVFGSKHTTPRFRPRAISSSPLSRPTRCDASRRATHWEKNDTWRHITVFPIVASEVPHEKHGSNHAIFRRSI